MTQAPRPSLSPASSRIFRSRLLTVWLPALIVLTVVAVFGVEAAAYKIAVVKKVQFIGHGDEAAYATMGRSLAEGRGLEVNYISWFFQPYSEQITRREDHWPPFLGMAIAPFFYLMGDGVWVAKIAPILLGSILLPLLTAALGMIYSRRAYVGLAAGLLILSSQVMFTESMKILSDVPVAALLAGFCGALLATRGRPWAHIVAGIFLALAFYAKGSEIMLLGLYPAGAVILSGWRVLRRKGIYLGLGTALFLMAPYMYSNYRIFGDPLHSTQNYVSGYIGLVDDHVIYSSWEKGTNKIYWGQDLPKPSDRWNKFPWERYVRLMRENAECFTRWAVLGPGTGKEPGDPLLPAGKFVAAGTWEAPDAWDDLGWLGWHLRAWIDPRPENLNRPVEGMKWPTEWQEPLHGVPGVAAVVGILVMLLGAPVLWWRRWRVWRKAAAPKGEPILKEGRPMMEMPMGRGSALQTVGAGRGAGGGLLRPTLVLVVILVAHWMFLVVFWQYLWMNRLAFVFAPIMLVIGCTMMGRVVEAPLRAGVGFYQRRRGGMTDGTGRGRRYVSLGVTVLLAVVVMILGPGWKERRLAEFAGDPAAKQFPWVDQADVKYTPSRLMGEYLATHYPQAVVMTRYPWQMAYHAAATNKTVNLPLDDRLERMLAVAKYYHCTFIVHDGLRWPMEPLFAGKVPGFRQVKDSPGGNLYELDWAQLPACNASEELGPSKNISAMR